MIRALSALALLTLYVTVHAEPIPIPGTQPIAPTFLQSDIVCNCVVDGVQIQSERIVYVDGKAITRRNVLATVHPQDIYKGAVASGITLVVEYEDEMPATRVIPSLQNGETAILFLKLSTTGVYLFADRFLGSTPFNAIPVQAGAPGLQKLESALVSILNQSSPNDHRSALLLLEGLPEFQAATVARLATESQSSDTDTALSAMAALLKASPSTGAHLLDKYLQTYSGDDQHIGFMSINGELGQITDPETEQSLESLASSKFTPIRFAAMDSLRRMKSPRSTSVFIERLDDSDPNVRYIAVISLAELMKKDGDYSPTMNLFDKNPDYYTSLWKGWWAQSGSTRR